MALSIIETEAGRAMLINAAMKQADLGRHLFHSEIFDMMREPWPHWVHYRGSGKPVYCAPDSFGFIGKESPSHCNWMVPGTHER